MRSIHNNKKMIPKQWVSKAVLLTIVLSLGNIKQLFIFRVSPFIADILLLKPTFDENAVIVWTPVSTVQYWMIWKQFYYSLIETVRLAITDHVCTCFAFRFTMPLKPIAHLFGDASTFKLCPMNQLLVGHLERILNI